MYIKNEAVNIELFSDGDGIMYNPDLGISAILNSASIDIYNCLLNHTYDEALKEYLKRYAETIKQQAQLEQKIITDFEQIVNNFLDCEALFEK